MAVHTRTEFAGSEQRLAFITQRLPVERGVRRVRVSADLDPVGYYMGAFTYLVLGYSSAETIVNLRVMEGTREVCSDRVSLARAISAVFGYPQPRGRRPVALQCEFTRAAHDSPATYNMVAELEAWAGVGGFAVAHAGGNGRLRQFQVLLDRR
jgi:hypothetical protein